MTNQEKICLLEKRLYLLTVNGRDNQGVRRKIQREIQKLQGMDEAVKYSVSMGMKPSR